MRFALTYVFQFISVGLLNGKFIVDEILGGEEDTAMSSVLFDNVLLSMIYSLE